MSVPVILLSLVAIALFVAVYIKANRSFWDGYVYGALFMGLASTAEGSLKGSYTNFAGNPFVAIPLFLVVCLLILCGVRKHRKQKASEKSCEST